VASGESRGALAECQRTRTFSKDIELLWCRNYGNCRIYPVLRIYPVNHPGEGDDFADVLGAGDPGDGALEA